ncbi:MAG: hypothetical protein Kow0099_09110 [Candidatus Abyssubacteria bacterium]
MHEYVECPNCHKECPAENLNCIYCGETLPAPGIGLLSSLRYSFKGWLAALIALAVIIAFLLLLL